MKMKAIMPNSLPSSSEHHLHFENRVSTAVPPPTPNPSPPFFPNRFVSATQSPPPSETRCFVSSVDIADIRSARIPV